jgi:hypothetical protein
MSKKKPIKQIFESASIESADVDKDLTESVSADAQSEETSPERVPQATGSETSPEAKDPSGEDVSIADEPAEESRESSSAEETPPKPESADEGPSNDDLLDDVRRSLIEQESDKGQTESKWWQRIGRKAKKSEPEAPAVPMEIDLPSMPDSTEQVEAQPLMSEAEEEVDQIDDLIDLFKAETEDVPAREVVTPEVEPPSEPEPEVDFDELKKQAFRPSGSGEDAEQFTDVRSIALEGGEEVLVEVDTKAPDPMEERMSAFENALRPYRQYIYTALAILGVGMAIVASLIIYNVYQNSRPQPVKEVSNLPYPTGVSLPGGWSFNLGKGSVQSNGEWNPKGAEWLEGTEVCRWVSLPWSRQLEAVVRTLNPKDPIDLVMSNNDKFTFQVYSVRQLTPQELQQTDTNTPCLLVILTQPDAEKRWVLTALP